MKSSSKYVRNDGTPSKRKFLGFNFYLQCNGKLSRKNRNYFLLNSENYLCSISNSLPWSTEEKMNKGIDTKLDSSLSDFELLDYWNDMYEKYGCLVPELKDKWEKSYLNVPKETFKHSMLEKYESKINELEMRIRKLELNLSKKYNIQNMG